MATKIGTYSCILTGAPDSADKTAMRRALNLHHIGHEECNELVDGHLRQKNHPNVHQLMVIHHLISMGIRKEFEFDLFSDGSMQNFREKAAVTVDEAEYVECSIPPGTSVRLHHNDEAGCPLWSIESETDPGNWIESFGHLHNCIAFCDIHSLVITKKFCSIRDCSDHEAIDA